MSLYSEARMDAIVRHVNENTPDGVPRMDAASTAFLVQELQKMRSKVITYDFAPLKCRIHIPTGGSDIDSGAEEFAWREEEELGEAKVISNYADDLPAVSTSAAKQTRKILSVGNAIHWSIQDIRRAAMARIPLDSKLLLSARMQWERTLDRIAFNGEASTGMQGFANTTGVTVTGATGTWDGSGLTPAQIITNINDLIADMVDVSKETLAPDTLVLPTAQYMHISQTRLSVDNPETIREALLRANPTLRSIGSWSRLAGAGAGAVDRAVLYVKNLDVMELVIPQEFEVFPPQPKSLAFVQNAHGRTAGTVIYKPLGVRYIDTV